MPGKVQGMTDAAPTVAQEQAAVPAPGRQEARAAEPAPWLAPAGGAVLFAAVVALAFNGGGFYAGATGIACATVALALLARVALVRRPFAGVGLPLAGTALLLAALAALALASASWSDAPAQAIIEYDRTLLYALVLFGAGCAGRTSARLRWLLGGLGAAAVVICVVALVTRLAPDVWPTEPNIINRRLSYPIGYWNALGLLGGLGFVICAHLASDERGRWWLKVLGAAALPVLAATIVLTYSRAGLGLTLAGLVIYGLLSRARGLPAALLAAGPPVAFAVVRTLDAELLATPDPTTPAAVAQGHDLALVLAGCVAVAALVRLVTVPVDGWIARLLAPPSRRRAARAAGAVALAGVVGVALAGGVVGTVETKVRDFVEDAEVDNRETPLRERLTESGGKTRILLWRHSIDQFEADPLRGSGAGTYERTWTRARPDPAKVGDLSVVDGHSLYLETLGELGLPGLLLLLAALAACLASFARLLWGPDRAIGALLLATGLLWAGHAGFDWDWEVPGVTLWLFAAAGLALAAPARGAVPGARATGWPVRLAAAAGFAALAVLPAQMAVSQVHLDRSADALRAQDCGRALPEARAATSALGLRPEPLRIAAVCELREGRPAEAVRLITRARERDPGDWALHYTEALIRASAGVDPHPAMARAVRLNPKDPFTIEGSRKLATDSRAAWMRRGPRLPLADG
jgi:O-antigen ligase